MTEIKIVFPLSCHSADALRTLQPLFSDFVLSWEFDDLPPCIFRTEIVEHVSIPLKNHYDRKCPAVVFRSIVALSTESDSDIVSLDKDSEAYFFCDEFCFYEVREVVMTLALALVIAHPEIHFGQLPFYTYLNEKCYDHDCCTKNPLHHDAYGKGDIVRVTMRFDNNLVSMVLDRFGHDIMLVKDGDSHFTVSEPIAVSPQFFAWIFGLGDKAEIVGPVEVRDQMRKMMEKMMRRYKPEK